MNDFTKEELNRLYSLTIVFDGEAILPLRNKIKSMIDNYCEHDFIPCLGTVALEICSKPDCMVLK